ncbi:MAG: aldo/keto reductase [Desulfobacterales bacterium]|nr:MAG: aldo/keto reductase [Desulfobacterales bacterium]
MKTVRLGQTDLKVSEIGFGGIPIIPLPEKEAVSVVKSCFDLGITFFDTANMYISSEAKIGAALEAVREKVIIATKTAQRGMQAAAEHIDLSLKQLKTDWIDIYQLHNVSNADALQQVLAPKGAYEAVAKARDAGKIRFIGFSSHSIQTARQTLQTGLFQTLQFPFNFIENDPAEELFPVAREHDVGIIGMKPLGGGLLERTDLCFRFLQQYPHVVPIPGIRTVGETEEIIWLYHDRRSLSEADRKDMEGIRSVLGEKFCHRCEYCMPCEQGVQIPSVLIFQAAAKRLSREGVTAWLGKAMDSVTECVECGECEEKCPYNLPITDLLKENLALFRQYA